MVIGRIFLNTQPHQMPQKLSNTSILDF